MDSTRPAQQQLLTHLHACDADFSPALSTRVHMGRYAEKINQNAVRFEAWAAGELVGLVAMYCNDHSTGVAFITHVSVLPIWQGQQYSINFGSTKYPLCLG
jgi:hypothetical protein